MSKHYKKILYPIIYWVLLIIIPLYFSIYLDNHDFVSDWAGYIFFYVLFIAPFLYIIPYKLIKPKKKIFFILVSFVTPLFLLYLYIFFQVQKTFHPLNW